MSMNLGPKGTSHSTGIKPDLIRPRIRSKGKIGSLTRGRRNTVYLVAAGVWLTGCLWLISHYFMTNKDEFGFDIIHPLQSWSLIAHAIFSFWAIWMFGVLWPIHIKMAWIAKVRWVSGGGLFLVLTWLSVTGFASYYLSNDIWRTWNFFGHWIPGVASAAAFWLHVVSKSDVLQSASEAGQGSLK